MPHYLHILVCYYTYNVRVALIAHLHQLLRHITVYYHTSNSREYMRVHGKLALHVFNSYYCTITVEFWYQNNLYVRSILLIFMLCFIAGLNPTSTPIATVQPPTTGKFIVSLLLHCLSEHLTIEWCHDLISTWELTRLVGTAWTINEPHLSEATVQGWERGIILPFKIFHKSMHKNYLVPLYNILFVRQLQVRSKHLVYTWPLLSCNYSSILVSMYMRSIEGCMQVWVLQK